MEKTAEQPVDKSYRILLITIILFLVSAFIIFLVSFVEMIISILVIFFFLTVLFFLTIWICTSKTYKPYRMDIFHIFYFTLFINIVAVVGSAYLFEYNIGIKTGANDETRMYIDGDITEKSKEEQQFTIDRAPYPLYLYMLTFISFIAKYLGENSPFTFKLLSAFFGGCVPVVIFTHFIRKYPIKKVKRIALFSGIFPCFTYYASIGVRDIIIILLTVLFFFLLIDKKRTIKRIVLLLGIICCMFFLRLEQAVFSLAIYIAYYFIESIRKFNYLRITAAIIVLAILLSGIMQFQGVIQKIIKKEIIEQREKYAQIFLSAVARKGTMDTSLTYKIRSLPIPANFIIMYGYNMLNSFPPYLLFETRAISKQDVRGPRWYQKISLETPKSSVSYGRTLKVLGPLVWYFVLPFVLIGFFHRKKYPFDFDEKFIILMCFLYIFTVSIFTVDIGRIVVVYGNLFPFGLMTRYQTPVNVRKKVDIFTLVFILLLLGVYLALKSGVL